MANIFSMQVKILNLFLPKRGSEQVQEVNILLNQSLAVRLRESRGLTRTELARIIGCSPAFVCQVESGGKTPSEDVCKKWAKALRVPTRTFMEQLGVVQ